MIIRGGLLQKGHQKPVLIFPKVVSNKCSHSPQLNINDLLLDLNTCLGVIGLFSSLQYCALSLLAKDFLKQI